MDRSQKENTALAALEAKALFDATSAAQEAFGDFGKKIANASLEASKLRVAFQQTFGIFQAEQGRDIVKTVTDTAEKLTDLGITTEKYAQAYKSVGEGINQFIVKRTDSAVESFARLIAVNERFGVGAETTLKIANQLGTSFGMSADKVTSFSNKLMEFAKETGQSFKKVFDDFNSSIQSFYTILNPEKAATQFMSFQQMAKGFGSTVNELMATAAKFDSIEEGVKFGADLNNILSTVGGSFDAMLASTMKYDDRIKYITQSIANSRDQINQMDEISQQAYLRQIQQSTGLSGQMIQAILKNNELVDNIDTLTDRTFAEVKEAPVDQMAKNFMTYQEKSTLFMNEYAKIGSRLEKFADQTAENAKEVQLKLLRPIAGTISEAKKVSEVIERIKETFTKFDLGKTLNEATDLIKEQAKKLEKSSGLGPPTSTKPVAYTAKTPATITSPAGTTTGAPAGRTIPDENIIVMRDSASSLATSAKKIAEKAEKPSEVIIHIKATKQLEDLLQILQQTGRNVSATGK